MTRLHVVVRGRVQGVGFRWFVREQATALDLAGWVKNRPDGAVEVAAEGNPAAVARLREHLRRGPSHAGVESVDDVGSSEPQPSTLPHPFTIVR